MNKPSIETIVKTYNDLIKSNTINLPHTVTYEWLKKQRVIKGRYLLNIIYGEQCIDSYFTKTSLGTAADLIYKNITEKSEKNLSSIARLLSSECKEVLSEASPIRKKYESLNSTISIPIYSISSGELKFFNPISFDIYKFNSSNLEITLEYLDSIEKYISSEKFYSSFTICFLNYIQKSVSLALTEAFNEILEEEANYICI